VKRLFAVWKVVIYLKLCFWHINPAVYYIFSYIVILYFNVVNFNKSDNLAISCQWLVLTERYLTRSTKLLWSNSTNPNPILNPQLYRIWTAKYMTLKYFMPVNLHSLIIRAPIDWPISRESSASPNLVGDRTAYAVCSVRSLTLIALPYSCDLDSVTIGTSPQWQSSWLQFERPLLTQCPSAPFLLLTAAARQQWQHEAKVINDNWKVLGVGLLEVWEIARIVASNTARINLPIMATIGALLIIG